MCGGCSPTSCAWCLDSIPHAVTNWAGFVWFQGFNGYVDGGVYPDQDKPGGYDLYAELLGHFIRDVRADLAAPRLPFVIGVMGIDGMRGDTAGNGAVDAADLAELLDSRRPVPAGVRAAADFDGNQSVDSLDLGELLSRWTQP
jgi:hypothetical protein